MSLFDGIVNKQKNSVPIPSSSLGSRPFRNLADVEKEIVMSMANYLVIDSQIGENEKGAFIDDVIRLLNGKTPFALQSLSKVSGTDVHSIQSMYAHRGNIAIIPPSQFNIQKSEKWTDFYVRGFLPLYADNACITVGVPILEYKDIVLQLAAQLDFPFAHCVLVPFDALPNA